MTPGMGGIAYTGRPDLPAIPYYHSRHPFYRHSRASGNPAVVCRGCGIIRQYRRDSRVSGNDGKKDGMDGREGGRQGR